MSVNDPDHVLTESELEARESARLGKVDLMKRAPTGKNLKALLNPDLKAIFGESDAMALGAAKAAKQANRTGIVFVGIDGFPTMFPAIKSGLVQATMAQNPYKMGEMAVENAIAIMNSKGKDIPAEQYMPTVLLSKTNVEQHNPADFYGPAAKNMQ